MSISVSLSLIPVRNQNNSPFIFGKFSPLRWSSTPRQLGQIQLDQLGHINQHQPSTNNQRATNISGTVLCLHSESLATMYFWTNKMVKYEARISIVQWLPIRLKEWYVSCLTTRLTTSIWTQDSSKILWWESFGDSMFRSNWSVHDRAHWWWWWRRPWFQPGKLCAT